MTTAPDIDARVALIQALIPVALDKVMEELQADVERLAGARYAREGRLPGHVRWTGQRGSVYLADQKLPIEVPRVRDQQRHVEVPLPTYERLQHPRTGDTGLLHKVLGGLSTREYERCAEAVPEAFGLSASTYTWIATINRPSSGCIQRFWREILASARLNFEGFRAYERFGR